VSEHEKRRPVEWLRAELARATGRRYRIDLDAFDVESLRELQRLLRDLDHEKQAAVNRARLYAWNARRSFSSRLDYP
jgi:hypothetical protein